MYEACMHFAESMSARGTLGIYSFLFPFKQKNAFSNQERRRQTYIKLHFVGNTHTLVYNNILSTLTVLQIVNLYNLKTGHGMKTLL